MKLISPLCVFERYEYTMTLAVVQRKFISEINPRKARTEFIPYLPTQTKGVPTRLSRALKSPAVCELGLKREQLRIARITHACILSRVNTQLHSTSMSFSCFFQFLKTVVMLA